MPLTFRILADRGLVVVRYSGHATIEETMAATKAYVASPDYAPGQKQLIDMTRITSYEKDYVRFLEMQAAKADRFMSSGVQSLVVYIAPTPVAQEIAGLFIRSWADVDAVVPLMQHSEAEALALLGQAEDSVDTLLAPVDGQALQ
ncbi:hypothetical protein [Tateyamaria sp. SN3-11]|uniref:hypothetical protein n=1 Tax=Tateyamaria sp. SN3-11 TaxID=3092147 RepID=UPI0039E800FC